MTPIQVPIVERVLNANDQIAAKNLAVLDKSGIYGVNIMASPGAGKTSLIMQTIAHLSPAVSMAVIEGDTARVTIDADLIRGTGIPAVQVHTAGGCHLDAALIADALSQLPLDRLKFLLVENVGNLVCPAAYKLGTHADILIASVPEGDDKPFKYPAIYRGIQALILNKVDLLPYVPFRMDYFRQGVEMLNPGVSFFPLSCKTGEGMEEWIQWLRQKIQPQI
jgi:hydrogenase nickel incorporation protein HypB